ncbi:hypothetical protein LJ737_04410 [Hymenobacter sp. 15J16-1T3B]|uniref:hypothetical protein n=1 Tax=Hymenobacter sp. 15J16-1T3B TaxID=2886941 RepID=UPI001D0FB738|nr:hypothetical protein [Hymenobacter sp. 15J16-1T3B]MCC3156466.1 hypothetical protein [Hymenobacter sp. 15J16-1T3B]
MLLIANAKPNVHLGDWNQLMGMIPLDKALRAPRPWLEYEVFEAVEANPHLADEGQYLLNLKAAQEAGAMKVR